MSFFVPLINDFFGEEVIEEGGFGDSLIDWGLKAATAYGVSKLLYDPPEKNNNSAPTPNAGINVQLAPATKNYLNVFYGTTWMNPVIVDAKISTDNKTMWYVLAFSEVPETGSISFSEFKWADRKINFDSTDPTKVVSFTDSTGAVDTKVNGYMYVYTYSNGSASPANSSIDARTLLADSAIASGQWTSSDTMSKTAFAVVKVIYNQEVGLTGLNSISAKMSNSLVGPGEVLYDYFTNTRYGCGVEPQNLNTQSFNDLNSYSAELISYTPKTGGGTRTAPRYTINGMIDVSQDCFSNLQYIAQACDSWIQWNEIVGKWGVVINKGYDQVAGSQTAKSINQLFNLNEDVIIGSVDFNPTDLNSFFNKIELTYYDISADSKQGEVVIELDEGDKSPNEPTNPMKLNMPLVNNYVQAHYLATRKLIQNREDLVVGLTCDYSGIQIEAGDVVRLNVDKYQWVNKLFRVSQVVEGKDSSGFLSVSLTLLEYNHQVYENIDISDFAPEGNTGISDPTIIDVPLSPVVVPSATTSSSIYALEVSATVPSDTIVTAMNFYTGTSSDTEKHSLYKVATSADGAVFNGGDTATITVTDLKPNSIEITSITKGANTVVTTSGAHGLQDNDIVYFYRVNGMEEINGSRPAVRVVSPTQFSLLNAPNAGLWDTSDFHDYTSGGVVQRPVYFSVRAATETSLSASSPAVAHRWTGPSNITGGVNSFAISNAAVTDTVIVTSNNTLTTNTPSLSTSYVMNGSQTGYITLNKDDIFTVDGSISGIVNWYTANGSISYPLAQMYIVGQEENSNEWDWILGFNIVGGGWLTTSDYNGNTAWSFSTALAGLGFQAPYSMNIRFAFMIVFIDSFPVTNTPQSVTTSTFAIRVGRFRK